MFSETVLGRFLQAVELYAVILYTLIAAFYHLRNVPAQATDESGRKRSPASRSPAGRFDLIFDNPPSPSSSVDLDFTFQQYVSKSQDRPSTAHMARSTSYGSKEVTPMRNIPPAPRGILSTVGNMASTTPATPRPAHRRFSNVAPREPVPLPSPAVPAVQAHTKSPTYGLSGSINANQVSALVRDESHNKDDLRTYFGGAPPSPGITGLLRRQEELDKSIAALELHKAGTTSKAATNRRASSSPVSPEPSRATSSSESDFTFSDFPEVPWGHSSTNPSVQRVSSTTPIHPPSRPLFTFDLNSLLLPHPVFAAEHRSRHQSVPTSESGDTLIPTARNRTSSEGTQYEITSFIGRKYQSISSTSR